MKKAKVINTQKAVIAALFFGAINFGYAQETTAAPEKAQSVPTEIAAAQQNPEIEGLKKQLEVTPDDTQIMVKLATAYQNAQDWKSAADTWNKVSTLLPDWAPSYYSLGYVYQTAKDDANAKMAYEKYIAKVKPEEVEASKKNLAYAHFFVAYQLQETDKENAKIHIAKSLEYDPTNEEAVKISAYLNQ